MTWQGGQLCNHYHDASSTQWHCQRPVMAAHGVCAAAAAAAALAAAAAAALALRWDGRWYLASTGHRERRHHLCAVFMNVI